ncbi:unnamed protein product [Callosobruchus maculatus]|uniref:Uncharacterized protein n=1 Tax=Callosobruchus maculatus TaxID=64391 RepID=A0A653DKT5_CALMS|nr:unnamed protein product [Callosobruchus maculatus]
MQAALDLRKYSDTTLKQMVKDAERIICNQSKHQELREKAQEDKEKLETELKFRAVLEDIKRLHIRALNKLYIDGKNSSRRYSHI